MRKILFAIITFIFIGINLTQAQELRCRVTMQYNEIGDADKDYFNALQKSIEEFMNSQIWTNKSFEEFEKIDMKMNFKISKKLSNTAYQGTIQIQSSRAVFNSTYTSPMLNHVDEKIIFEYEENQSIEFSENSYVSNLSHTLAYYAYIVIGLDFDSFSLNGGTEYFQKAQQLVDAGRSQNDSEWGTTNKEGRYWLVENLLNSTYSGFRNAMYTYHRLGLDIMHAKPDEGRKNITKAIQELQKVYKLKPGALILRVFFYAKKSEIINVYSEAQPDEKALVVGLLKQMNPANANDYDKILAK